MTADKSLISQIPYAHSLGLSCSVDDKGIRFLLKSEERFIGNPMIRAFHGGIINGLLGCSMRLATMRVQNLEFPPELVSITTTYLRSAKIEFDLISSVRINRVGKRIISVSADAFQRREGEELILVAQASASLRIFEDEKA